MSVCFVGSGSVLFSVGISSDSVFVTGLKDVRIVKNSDYSVRFNALNTKRRRSRGISCMSEFQNEQKKEEKSEKKFSLKDSFHRFRTAVPTFLLGSGAGAFLVCAAALSLTTIEEPTELAAASALQQQISLFDMILHDIDLAYVDKVDTQKLFETGVNAMLSSLDPYTQFENLKDAQELAVKTSGRYGGVGLGIGPDVRDEKHVMVLNAFEGYAFEAGLRPGDLLVSIDGVAVSELGLEKATERLRGEPGTEVKVLVSRPGSKDLLSFQLKRNRITIRDVPAVALIGDPADRIGYIKLQSFARNAGKEVRLALQTLTASCASTGGLNGVILDLRWNPGGLLDGSVEVASQFVAHGSPIVATKGRALGTDIYMSDLEPVLPRGTKLAVLVNGQSASASEIVAGAIQDLDAGVIVGSRTYGKGLVQNIQALPYDTALRYTVGRYYTPSGRCIQAIDYSKGTKDTKRFDDSQRKEYKTLGGRTVRDSGGIDPDVVVEVERPSELEQSLMSTGAFLDFADKFESRRPSMTRSELDVFQVDNKLYEEFQTFVRNNKSKYEAKTSVDGTLAELDTALKESGYRRATTELQELRQATIEDMDEGFVSHGAEVKRRLEHFIRVRYEPQSKWIVADLKNDVQVQRAVEVLRSRSLYTDLLTPQKNAESQPAVAASDSARDLLFPST
eukprot:CAMPEP_0182447856 /NCGR_PEP_ID=MMETSP1172-20130603/20956_1 /TAXON_ID=708627 /ORGANISM="Timspurckia oligopyrenoides, Strain CCMP3278" /LENGTH=676 /DNA_ID=CAMNT_0024644471 /DNA_START=119 /DNA_END=2149 /DNA_ORIENTATION=-